MKIVEWVDPWPAKDKNGIEYTVAVTYRMKAEDAINVERAVYFSHMATKLDLRMPTDEVLLQDFVTVHWATIKEVEGDGVSGD